MTDINYTKKPEFTLFDPAKHSFFNWITGVVFKARSVGWSESLLGTYDALEEIDKPAPGATDAQIAQYRKYVRAYNSEMNRRAALSSDCMSAIYQAVVGDAQDAIKFCSSPNEAYIALQRKFQKRDIGLLFTKLVKLL
jgi:hypothetical protein